LEVQLVKAAEDHVSAEDIDMLWLQVFTSMLIDVACGEPEVDKVDGGVVEHVLAVFI